MSTSTNKQNIGRKVSKEKQPEPIKDQKRRIYRFGNNVINIANSLKFSVGKTVHSISDATFIGRHVISQTLQRMRSYGMVEIIKNFGWRITRYGIEVLEILFRKTDNNINNNNVNTTNTQYLQKEKMIIEKEEEIPKTIPSCFKNISCTIKKYWKDKRFTKKALVNACEFCVKNERKVWEQNIPNPDFPLEMVRRGLTL